MATMFFIFPFSQAYYGPTLTHMTYSIYIRTEGTAQHSNAIKWSAHTVQLIGAGGDAGVGAHVNMFTSATQCKQNEKLQQTTCRY